MVELQEQRQQPESGISRKIHPDSSTNYRDQLSIVKTNFLNPAEVTFSKLEYNKAGRQRLTTISSETSEIESLTSSTNHHRSKKRIPDGGYGWVVVFASLMVSLIADGVSFSFGLLYTELLDYFNEGTTKTAWVHKLYHRESFFNFSCVYSYSRSDLYLWLFLY